MNFTDCVQEKFQFHKNLKRRRYRPRRGRRWFIVGQSVWIKWWKRMVRKWRPDVGKWRTKKSNKKFEKKRKKKESAAFIPFISFCWSFVRVELNSAGFSRQLASKLGSIAPILITVKWTISADDEWEKMAAALHGKSLQVSRWNWWEK